jgi:hypothetical protein
MLIWGSGWADIRSSRVVRSFQKDIGINFGKSAVIISRKGAKGSKVNH